MYFFDNLIFYNKGYFKGSEAYHYWDNILKLKGYSLNEFQKNYTFHIKDLLRNNSLVSISG